MHCKHILCTVCSAWGVLNVIHLTLSLTLLSAIYLQSCFVHFCLLWYLTLPHSLLVFCALDTMAGQMIRTSVEGKHCLKYSRLSVSLGFD